MSKGERISGWGRRPWMTVQRVPARSVAWPEPVSAPGSIPTDRQGGLPALFDHHPAAAAAGCIPRGLGRSYGDSALAPLVVDTAGLDRMLSLDPQTPCLTAEAGISLWDLNRILTPRGLAVPVVPGTQFVTLGGMLASDVHGKNHHVDGSIARHVLWLDLALPQGGVIRCSPADNGSLFHATLGGMGLTGLILRACLRLERIRTSFIVQKTRRVPDLEAMLSAFEADHAWPYSVAWIDCLAKGKALGRGVVMLGRRAQPEDLRTPDQGLRPLHWSRKSLPGIPVSAPGFVLNSLTMSAFNRTYFALNGDKTSVVDAQSFFHPLDAIAHWNRLYGRRGFHQYQCVLPLETSAQGLRDLLQATASAGQGSFLSVLKRLGPAAAGPLSFPREGYTLALDFPWRRGTDALLHKLDAIVLRCGGRLYLTKDACMPREMLRAGYPDLDPFLQVRQHLDPGGRLASRQSQRLGL